MWAQSGAPSQRRSRFQPVNCDVAEHPLGSMHLAQLLVRTCGGNEARRPRAAPPCSRRTPGGSRLGAARARGAASARRCTWLLARASSAAGAIAMWVSFYRYRGYDTSPVPCSLLDLVQYVSICLSGRISQPIAQSTFPDSPIHNSSRAPKSKLLPNLKLEYSTMNRAGVSV